MEGEEADGLLSWPLVAHTPPPFFFLLLLLFRLFGGGGLSSESGAGGAGGLSGLGGIASSSIEYGMMLVLLSDEDISGSYKRIRIITLQLAHARAIKATHQICVIYICVYIYIYIYTYIHTRIQYICVYIYIYIYNTHTYIHAYSDTLGIPGSLLSEKAIIRNCSNLTSSKMICKALLFCSLWSNWSLYSADF